MCDAVYLGAALVGLLAIGTLLRIFVGKSSNAELVIRLLAEDGAPILIGERKPQASPVSKSRVSLLRRAFLSFVF